MKPASQANPLPRLRRRVDAVDRALVRLLARRLRLVRAIRPLKSRARDPRREAAVAAHVLAVARRFGADEAFVKEVYAGLLRACRDYQRRATRGEWDRVRRQRRRREST